MSIWHIYGGNRLTGSTQVQGAKNAVLPIMAAMAANKGEWYRYPFTLRLVKGPMDQPGAAQGPGGGQSF